MKVKDVSQPLMSGRMGNLVYYVRKGKQCVRRYGIPGKKRKKGNSQAKREANVRFGTTQAYYKYFCEKVSADIWRRAAALQGMMPHNLFFSVNSRYFGMDEEGNGVLVDCERFRFAEGELALPREVRVERDGDGWRAVWQDERLAVSGAASDRLQAGVIYDALPMGVRMALEVEGTRGDSTGRFVLDGGMMGREAMERRRRELEAAGRHEAWMDAEGELPEGRNGGAHVYLYFMREDGTAFSPSAYFRLTMND